MTASTLPLSPALSKSRRYTVAEYLEIERTTGERHTFINGRLFPMAGGTITHNRIVLNISVQLSTLLAGRPEYEVFNNETKIYLPTLQIYHYPDALVVAGVPLLAQEEIGAITNPILIIEVLSDSTGRYDRLDKFSHYQTLPSFREYVLIYQDRPQIDSYLRQDDPALWRKSEFSGLDGTVHFQSIDVPVELSKIYRNVSFETAE